MHSRATVHPTLPQQYALKAEAGRNAAVAAERQRDTRKAERMGRLSTSRCTTARRSAAKQSPTPHRVACRAVGGMCLRQAPTPGQVCAHRVPSLSSLFCSFLHSAGHLWCTRHPWHSLEELWQAVSAPPELVRVWVQREGCAPVPLATSRASAIV